MNQEKEKSQEEIIKEAEARKKEFDTFMKGLKDNSKDALTKGDLLKAIEFISDDMQGIGEMAGVALHNTGVLNQNFQQLVALIRGNAGNSLNKTKSGIILP